MSIEETKKRKQNKNHSHIECVLFIYRSQKKHEKHILDEPNKCFDDRKKIYANRKNGAISTYIFMWFFSLYFYGFRVMKMNKIYQRFVGCLAYRTHYRTEFYCV